MCLNFSKAKPHKTFVKPHKFLRTRVCYRGLKFKFTTNFKNAVAKISDGITICSITKHNVYEEVTRLFRKNI